MNSLDFSRARRILNRTARLANASVLVAKTLLFVVLLGAIMYSCSANAATGRPNNWRPAPHYSRVVTVHHHDHKITAGDVLPYVFIGAIVGIVLYDSMQPRCTHGQVCVRF